jgi:DNA-binding NarL/FixJ family response regulator
LDGVYAGLMGRSAVAAKLVAQLLPMARALRAALGILPAQRDGLRSAHATEASRQPDAAAFAGWIRVSADPPNRSVAPASAPAQPRTRCFAREMGDVPALPLTVREREVARLVAQGLSNRQIAAALVVAEGTVANRVHHILGKLDLASRAQVAAWAAEQGLLQRA